MQKEVKLWNRNFVFIIIINFLVFLNYLSILSTFPFYIEYLGGSEAVAGVGGGIAGMLISSFGYGEMFVIMAVFNILSILVYILIGRNHPSSFTYRKKMERA